MFRTDDHREPELSYLVSYLVDRLPGAVPARLVLMIVLALGSGPGLCLTYSTYVRT
jgi:hypothetical protein